jgi:hypothetical protein
MDIAPGLKKGLCIFGYHDWTEWKTFYPGPNRPPVRYRECRREGCSVHEEEDGGAPMPPPRRPWGRGRFWP